MKTLIKIKKECANCKKTSEFKVCLATNSKSEAENGIFKNFCPFCKKEVTFPELDKILD